jgi:hypothetical protein
MLCKKCNEDGKGRNIRGANVSKTQDSNKRGISGARKAILVKKTPIVRKRKPTGEADLFREIWEERDPWCEWCGKGILEFNVANYHHLIEKSKSLKLRLDKSNIVKICFDCHFKAHNG